MEIEYDYQTTAVLNYRSQYVQVIVIYISVLQKKIAS